MKHGNIKEQMKNGIDKSELFLCCATPGYCESDNCYDEIKYASYKKKPIIFILFEQYIRACTLMIKCIINIKILTA